MKQFALLLEKVLQRPSLCPLEPTKEKSQTYQNELFDDVSRLLAGPTPRRQALKLAVTGITGMGLANLVSKPVSAQLSCELDCQGTSYDPATQCCTPSGVQQKNPIKDLAVCPDRIPRPGYVPPTANGCGSVKGQKYPNGYGFANFLDCCNQHDKDYDACNKTKLSSDSTFGICLQRACFDYNNPALIVALLLNPRLYEQCAVVASAYFAAVVIGGDEAYKDAQKNACDCCQTPPLSSFCQPQAIFCACNQICYGSALDCLANCRASLGCFTDICRPAEPGECE